MSDDELAIPADFMRYETVRMHVEPPAICELCGAEILGHTLFRRRDRQTGEERLVKIGLGTARQYIDEQRACGACVAAWCEANP